jgi:hypothetical protein
LTLCAGGKYTCRFGKLPDIGSRLDEDEPTAIVAGGMLLQHIAVQYFKIGLAGLKTGAYMGWRVEISSAVDLP